MPEADQTANATSGETEAASAILEAYRENRQIITDGKYAREKLSEEQLQRIREQYTQKKIELECFPCGRPDWHILVSGNRDYDLYLEGISTDMWLGEAGMYQLVFCDKELSYEDHREMFCIGIFSSFDKAKETAEYYLHHVEGFKDYDCCYEIIEKDMAGHGGSEVYMVYGWDENEDMDEVNIIESHCFAQEDAARGHLLTMQQNYDRMRWSVSRYVVDQCLWKDGFVRV